MTGSSSGSRLEKTLGSRKPFIVGVLPKAGEKKEKEI